LRDAAIANFIVSFVDIDDLFLFFLFLFLFLFIVDAADDDDDAAAAAARDFYFGFEPLGFASTS